MIRQVQTMSQQLTRFTNCRIVRDHKLIREDLYVRNGVIIDPKKIFYEEKIAPKTTVDMRDKILAPGFIDIQINGGFGFDFSHNYNDIELCLSRVAMGILSHGVTSFCPTLVTSKSNVYKKVIPKIKKRRGGNHGAEILGVHVEGPFISQQKRGAHSSADIVEFDKGVSSLEDVYGDLENIKIVTLAPEKNHALDVIKYLNTKNVVASLGHSEANFSVGTAAMEQGARLITHLFNAMLPFHHRDPGLVGLLSTDNDLPIYYGIIADGVHTHPAALRIAYKTHAAGAVLVTDAISALGLLEGTHHLGEKMVEVIGNKAYIAGTNTLCGSVTTMNRCVATYQNATGCTLVEALEAASLHPARALNLETKKGTLNFGADADFIAIDEDLTVDSTWIAGECVFQH